MFLVIVAALLFASLFVIVLPGAILVAALLVNLRSSPMPAAASAPEPRLCLAADMADPAAKPCFADQDTLYCERHRPLERAS